MSDNPDHWITATSPEGIPYFHNVMTGKSTWEAPPHLKTPSAEEGCGWAEIQLPDHRSFFVNFREQKSQWRLPHELKVFRQRQIELSQPVQNVEIEKSLRQMEAEKHSIYREQLLTNELRKQNVDAPGLFLQLLSDCGITANMKWDQVFKVIQGDARNTLIKTISEKKKLF